MTLKRVALAIPYSQQALVGIGNFLASHTRWRIDWEMAWAEHLSVEEWADYPGDGVIIQLTKWQPLETILANPRATVSISDCGWDEHFPTVRNDNRAIGHMGAEHLLERGYRNFLFVCDNEGLYATERRAGFMETLGQAGFDADSFVVHGPSHPEGANLGKMRRLMEQKAKPFAIMCDSDSTAHYVARTCLEAEIHVPDEIAILGVDNDVARCNLDLVPLSSIVTDMETVGYKAAGLLDAMMRGIDVPTDTIEIAPLKVEVRQSTDTLAIEDKLVAQALSILRQEVNNQITPEDLSKQLDVSRRTLDRRFKTHLGTTVADRIQWHRIDRVKQLLRETTFPMAEIASKAGFSDINHLGHAFRREVGMSPSEYRGQFHETPAGARS